jgi:hypothetical protein
MENLDCLHAEFDTLVKPQYVNVFIPLEGTHNRLIFFETLSVDTQGIYKCFEMTQRSFTLFLRTNELVIDFKQGCSLFKKGEMIGHVSFSSSQIEDIYKMS